MSSFAVAGRHLLAGVHYVLRFRARDYYWVFISRSLTLLVGIVITYQVGFHVIRVLGELLLCYFFFDLVFFMVFQLLLINYFGVWLMWFDHVLVALWLRSFFFRAFDCMQSDYRLFFLLILVNWRFFLDLLVFWGTFR